MRVATGLQRAYPSRRRRGGGGGCCGCGGE